jgi:hypothetical protein
MKTHFTIIVLVFGLFCKTKADSFGYNDSLRIQIETENFIVVHFHDWTDNSRESRYKMISTTQDPFTSENEYSYIECKNKKTGQTLFKKPCSALTFIKVSPDEKYILGISNIMVWNPFQLVVYDLDGNLIKKRHIGSLEAKLNTKKFTEFRMKFPDQFRILDSMEVIYKYKRFFFIDFGQLGLHDKINEAWEYLFDFISPNHLSDCFRETVTNWVYWYIKDSSEIKFVYRDSKLFSISLMDLCKQRFDVRINEKITYGNKTKTLSGA